MFYLLNKKKGISSFKAIKEFARERGIKKIGHTGTLDPLASGLLLIATDDDTKLIEYIDKGFKTYKATMLLGKTSDTYDITGEILEEKEVKVTEEEVINAIRSFEGKYDQNPPSFSARKVDGVRAYELARKGQEVKLKSSLVEIKDLNDIKKVSDNEYEFEVTVSRGTYIRSLIFDIGEKLGCGALMTELVRTKIGSLELVEDFEEVNVESLLILDIIDASKEISRLLNGLTSRINIKDGTYALKANNDIVGIGIVKDNILKGKKIFGNKLIK